MIFELFFIIHIILISIWKKLWPYIYNLQTVVSPPYKGCFVPRLVEIGPVVISGEKYFQMLQLLFSHHLPLHGIAGRQDLEQTWIFFTQGYALCQVRLKLTQ